MYCVYIYIGICIYVIYLGVAVFRVSIFSSVLGAYDVDDALQDCGCWFVQQVERLYSPEICCRVESAFLLRFA